MNAPAASSLYSREVLRLATSLPHDDRLNDPQGSATCRSPVCGSEMSVDVTLNEGRISQIAIRARACALGQASAAVLREKAFGLTAADIKAAHAKIESALKSGSDIGWPELEPLAYARDYPARHGAILLPFETLLAAIKQGQA
jgi:NifU-like protein involved in Fe-S cluster formation